MINAKLKHTCKQIYNVDFAHMLYCKSALYSVFSSFHTDFGGVRRSGGGGVVEEWVLVVGVGWGWNGSGGGR